MESIDPLDDFLLRWNTLRAQSSPPNASASQIWSLYRKKRQQEQKQIFAFGAAAVMVMGLTLFTLNQQLNSTPQVETAINPYEPFNLYVYEP